jgi:hypothetical protein
MFSCSIIPDFQALKYRQPCLRSCFENSMVYTKANFPDDIGIEIGVSLAAHACSRVRLVKV